MHAGACLVILIGMTNAILMLYGNYSNEKLSHPWQEDMFRRPDQIQAALAEHGLEFHIGLATKPPAGLRQIGNVPEIRVAANPVYDQTTGELLEAHFKPGNLADYPGVIDHWVANFQDAVVQQDGSRQRTAYGLGLPNNRVWNARPIQEMGNHKDHMDTVLQAHGVGMPTYSVQEHDKFHDEQGDRKLIYKPVDGSRSKGVEVFANVAGLRRALADKRLALNGIIQPYFDIYQPMPGLVAATPADARTLAEVNARPDRARELRVHVVTTTDDNGELQTEARPTLMHSRLDTDIMRIAGYVSLDPDCLGPGTFIHDKSVALAQAVCAEAARRSGEPISQYYGVFDWLIDGDKAVVCEGNCRGPALPVEAAAARESFIRGLARSAKQVLSG
jgi:hypothetical protein